MSIHAMCISFVSVEANLEGFLPVAFPSSLQLTLNDRSGKQNDDVAAPIH